MLLLLLRPSLFLSLSLSLRSEMPGHIKDHFVIKPNPRFFHGGQWVRYPVSSDNCTEKIKGFYTLFTEYTSTCQTVVVSYTNTNERR